MILIKTLIFLRSFTSGCCSLPVMIFKRKEFFYSCFIVVMIHFSHTQAGLFWIVCCKRHLTNKQRYKVVRVGGWERTLSSLFQLRDRAEQVVWGYLLSLTTSNTASGPPLLLWCSWELCCADELEFLQHIPQSQMAFQVHCNYLSNTFTLSS